MSITPIEGDEVRGSEESTSGTPRSGVRARLWATLDALGSRLRSLLDSVRGDAVAPSGGETDTDGQPPNLRVGGQRRLESGPVRDDVADEPPTRGSLPGSTRVVAEEHGDELRIYNPEHTDAYVASDTWEDIER